MPITDKIHQKILKSFRWIACLWQCKATHVVVEGVRDVVCISRIGSGKTLTFQILLLFREDRIQIIITSLNILGEQNHEQLHDLGISAVTITGESATIENFKVSTRLQKQKDLLTVMPRILQICTTMLSLLTQSKLCLRMKALRDYEKMRSLPQK